MTSKQYLFAVLFAVLLLVGSFTGYNYARDDFGLFHSDAPKRIWTLEKTSKHLLAYNYVPQKFEGLILGPSYSDELFDTRLLRGYRVYNMSIDGGNATELLNVARPAIESGRIRFIVICLAAYLTKDSGIKGNEINDKEYWGSLFSWLPVQMLQARHAIESGAEPDLFANSEWGATDVDARPTYTWDAYIEKDKKIHITDSIDPMAYQHMRELVQLARAHNVQIFGYFHPYSRWRWQKLVDEGRWTKYRETILQLFDPSRDVVIDLTAPQYDSMRSDVSCYTDGHLSRAGAYIVMNEIQRMLDAHYLGKNAPPLERLQEPYACLRQLGAGSGYDRVPKELQAHSESRPLADRGRALVE